MPGKLVLVATPIGNLGDFPPRAVKAVSEADIILAEDTRRSAVLLKHYLVSRTLVSYHEHNAQSRIPKLTQAMKEGKTIALLSDAGTPGISDPAFKAVKIAIQNGSQIQVIPGPSAVVTALVGSGLPVDRFAFEGFLPKKSGRRKQRLESMKDYSGTLIYFIGPHHLVKYVDEMKSIFGDRYACVARELTKLFEEFIRGSFSELQEYYSKRKPKGEITLVVGPEKRP